MYLSFVIGWFSCAVYIFLFYLFQTQILVFAGSYISNMYFTPLAILSLSALSFAAPVVVPRQAGAVLKDTTYNAISISGGQAGNAKAEAAARFSALDLQNLKNINKADLTFLNEVNQVANDAEKEVFNPAVEAASGDAATQIQVSHIFFLPFVLFISPFRPVPSC